MVFPHGYEVFGTKDECFQAMIVLEPHVPKAVAMSVLPSPTTSPIMTPPASVQVMRCNLYAAAMKIKELFVKFPRNAELGESCRASCDRWYAILT